MPYRKLEGGDLLAAAYLMSRYLNWLEWVEFAHTFYGNEAHQIILDVTWDDDEWQMNEVSVFDKAGSKLQFDTLASVFADHDIESGDNFAAEAIIEEAAAQAYTPSQPDTVFFVDQPPFIEHKDLYVLESE